MCILKPQDWPARPGKVGAGLTVFFSLCSIFLFTGKPTAAALENERANSSALANSSLELPPFRPQNGSFTSTGFASLLASQNALSNIVCREVVSRYTSRGARGSASLRDRFEATVEVLDGKERYSDVLRNRKAYTGLASLPGTWSAGEMATMLRITADAMHRPNALIAHERTVDNRLADRFRFEVPADFHAWYIKARGARYWIGFEGDVWLSEKTGAIETLSWRSTDIPAAAGIAEVVWTVDYAVLNLAGRRIALPGSSEFEVNYTADRRIDRNSTLFTGYRRYGSATSVQFE